MTDIEEARYIETAAAALNSSDRRQAVFWSEKVAAAIKGKADVDQLPILAEMIADAEQSKLEGRGPSQCDIDTEKRRYIRIASEVYRTKASIR